MIATKPNYIDGDKLTIRQYLVSLFNDDYPLYSSVWVWWKKTTLFWSMPLGFTSLILFCSLLYQDLAYFGTFNWLLTISLSLMMFVFFMPLIWAVGYYYAFVSPKKVKKLILSFLSEKLPDAQKIRSLSLANYLFTWNGIEYELAYSLIPCVNAKGKVTRYRQGLIICMYYSFMKKYRSEIIDEDGNLQESLVEEWNVYCRGKESCKGLVLDLFAIYSFREVGQLASKEQVQTMLEQIEYLANKFHFFPLSLDFSIRRTVNRWLDAINHPAPDDIVALNVGLFESDKGYSLYLVGAKHYDAEDDSWACQEDFVPEEKYLDLSDYRIGGDDWKDVLKLVILEVESYVADHAEDENSLFYHKVVTVGFDDGDLFRVK